MSIFDTSIKRPYIGGREYLRVIDSNFRELTKTSSTDNVEDLIKEYKRLKDSFPPEIHNLIYTNSLRVQGIDPSAEDFAEIDRLNHVLDGIESQENQQFTIDAREHPHFRNGSFIRGTIYEVIFNDEDNEPEGYETRVAYYFMQKGHKRQIENYNLFKILYANVSKKDPDKDERKKIPFLTAKQLTDIPIAAPILTETIGSETKFTNIFELPEGYYDAADISQIIKRYGNLKEIVPEEQNIKQKVFKFVKQQLIARTVAGTILPG
jgi:hypothetical protein